MAFIDFDNARKRNLCALSAVMVTSILVLFINLWGPVDSLVFWGFGSRMSIAFKVDGLSRLFSAITAILWPLATVYAFDYMEHEGDEKRFFCFYTVTYGVTLAIAYSANFLTIYLFYELLTLVTLPLVIHKMNQESFAAGRKYIYYSISGAALIFICLAFIYSYGDTLDFRMGGVFSGEFIVHNKTQILQTFTIAFIGFGVKAALFPSHGWLPCASVAPTTVTALLHAVAVVKAGAFAIMRLTHYLFGSEILLDTWAQHTVIVLTLLTILYGSARAWYTTHFKRRLAYSTVSQLSYVLFAVALLTPEGLAAAMMYMLAHSFIKITLFFSCGAVYVMAARYDLKDMEGLGRHMPITFATFTIAALALMGLPPTAGFTAKLQLLTAAIQSGNLTAQIGTVVIVISMLLTAAYLFSIIKTAYFPRPRTGFTYTEPVSHDPGSNMTIPLRILAFIVIIIGFMGKPLLEWFALIVKG